MGLILSKPVFLEMRAKTLSFPLATFSSASPPFLCRFLRFFRLDFPRASFSASKPRGIQGAESFV